MRKVMRTKCFAQTASRPLMMAAGVMFFIAAHTGAANAQTGLTVPQGLTLPQAPEMPESPITSWSRKLRALVWK